MTSLSVGFLRMAQWYPVLWIAGLEQFLIPAMFLWLTFQKRRMIAAAPWPAFASVACLLVVWWLVPVLWIPRQQIHLLIRDFAVIAALAGVVLVSVSERTRGRDVSTLYQAMTWMAIWVNVGVVVYQLALWRGSFPSLVGLFLPPSLVENSEFVSTIARRTFGSLREVDASRVSSIGLKYTDLSFLAVVLLPIQAVLAGSRRGAAALGHAVLAAGLMFALIASGSRAGLGAAGVALVVSVMTGAGILSKRARWLVAGFTPGLIALGILVIFIFAGRITEGIESAFLDYRSGSAVVRFRIYYETVRLLPEHWIAGWGAQLPIAGLPNTYSAGTHSMHLALIFQHGVVGWIFYLVLVGGLWRLLIQALSRAVGRERWLLAGIAGAMAALNVREVADAWLWDQTVCLVIAMLWSIAIAVGSTDAEELGASRAVA